MLRIARTVSLINCRTFKNFGHKRQPDAPVTVLWHGFLTFTFIGLTIEWKRISRLLFGDDGQLPEAEDSPLPSLDKEL